MATCICFDRQSNAILIKTKTTASTIPIGYRKLTFGEEQVRNAWKQIHKEEGGLQKDEFVTEKSAIQALLKDKNELISQINSLNRIYTIKQETMMKEEQKRRAEGKGWQQSDSQIEQLWKINLMSEANDKVIGEQEAEIDQLEDKHQELERRNLQQPSQSLYVELSKEVDRLRQRIAQLDVEVKSPKHRDSGINLNSTEKNMAHLGGSIKPSTQKSADFWSAKIASTELNFESAKKERVFLKQKKNEMTKDIEEKQHEIARLDEELNRLKENKQENEIEKHIVSVMKDDGNPEARKLQRRKRVEKAKLQMLNEGIAVCKKNENESESKYVEIFDYFKTKNEEKDNLIDDFDIAIVKAEEELKQRANLAAITDKRKFVALFPDEADKYLDTVKLTPLKLKNKSQTPNRKVNPISTSDTHIQLDSPKSTQKSDTLFIQPAALRNENTVSDRKSSNPTSTARPSKKGKELLIPVKSRRPSINNSVVSTLLPNRQLQSTSSKADSNASTKVPHVYAIDGVKSPIQQAKSRPVSLGKRIRPPRLNIGEQERGYQGESDNQNSAQQELYPEHKTDSSNPQNNRQNPQFNQPNYSNNKQTNQRYMNQGYPENNNIYPYNNNSNQQIPQGNPQTNPQAYQTNPSINNVNPQVYQTNPLINQASPQGYLMDQAHPQVYQKNPQINHANPQVYQTNPQINQASPQVYQTNPQINQASPYDYQTNPQLNQVYPEVYQTNPQAYQTNPQINQSNSLPYQPNQQTNQVYHQIYQPNQTINQASPQIYQQNPQINQVNQQPNQTNLYNSNPQINQANPQINYQQNPLTNQQNSQLYNSQANPYINNNVNPQFDNGNGLQQAPDLSYQPPNSQTIPYNLNNGEPQDNTFDIGINPDNINTIDNASLRYDRNNNSLQPIDNKINDSFVNNFDPNMEDDFDRNVKANQYLDDDAQYLQDNQDYNDDYTLGGEYSSIKRLLRRKGQGKSENEPYTDNEVEDYLMDIDADVKPDKKEDNFQAKMNSILGRGLGQSEMSTQLNQKRPGERSEFSTLVMSAPPPSLKKDAQSSQSIINKAKLARAREDVGDDVLNKYLERVLNETALNYNPKSTLLKASPDKQSQKAIPTAHINQPPTKAGSIGYIHNPSSLFDHSNLRGAGSKQDEFQSQDSASKLPLDIEMPNYEMKKNSLLSPYLDEKYNFYNGVKPRKNQDGEGVVNRTLKRRHTGGTTIHNDIIEVDNSAPTSENSKPRNDGLQERIDMLQGMSQEEKDRYLADIKAQKGQGRNQNQPNQEGQDREDDSEINRKNTLPGFRVTWKDELNHADNDYGKPDNYLDPQHKYICIQRDSSQHVAPKKEFYHARNAAKSQDSRIEIPPIQNKGNQNSKYPFRHKNPEDNQNWYDNPIEGSLNETGQFGINKNNGAQFRRRVRDDNYGDEPDIYQDSYLKSRDNIFSKNNSLDKSGIGINERIKDEANQTNFGKAKMRNLPNPEEDINIYNMIQNKSDYMFDDSRTNPNYFTPNKNINMSALHPNQSRTEPPKSFNYPFMNDALQTNSKPGIQMRDQKGPQPLGGQTLQLKPHSNFGHDGMRYPENTVPSEMSQFSKQLSEVWKQRELQDQSEDNQTRVVSPRKGNTIPQPLPAQPKVNTVPQPPPAQPKGLNQESNSTKQNQVPHPSYNNSGLVSPILKQNSVHFDVPLQKQVQAPTEVGQQNKQNQLQDSRPIQQVQPIQKSQVQPNQQSQRIQSFQPVQPNKPIQESQSIQPKTQQIAVKQQPQVEEEQVYEFFD